MKNRKEIAVYCFSATGNSLKLALDITSNFAHSKIYRIGPEENIEESNAQMIGFIFPVYMGGLPGIVDKFLKNFSFRKGVYYFAIGTYYTYKGCAMSVVNKILRDKGVSLSYNNYLPSVGNCLKEYEVSPPKRIKILKRSEVYTQSIINDLNMEMKKKKPTYYRLVDLFHKKLFNIFFSEVDKQFSLESYCVGCKICEKVCPVSNIRLKDRKPQWGTNCEACHACVHNCPKNAINIGRSKGRLQYRHPEIKNEMLFKFLYLCGERI